MDLFLSIFECLDLFCEYFGVFLEYLSMLIDHFFITGIIQLFVFVSFRSTLVCYEYLDVFYKYLGIFYDYLVVL